MGGLLLLFYPHDPISRWFIAMFTIPFRRIFKALAMHYKHRRLRGWIFRRLAAGTWKDPPLMGISTN